MDAKGIDEPLENKIKMSGEDMAFAGCVFFIDPQIDQSVSDPLWRRIAGWKL